MDADLEEQEEAADHAALDVFLASTTARASVSDLPPKAQCQGASCTKKVHCTRSGCKCKGCACKKNKETCDSKCVCTDETCDNRPRQQNNPFAQWDRVTEFDASAQLRFPIPEFDESQCGPTQNVPQFRSPVDTFYHFIPRETFEAIAEATTTYAANPSNWAPPTNAASQPVTRERKLLPVHREGFKGFQIRAYLAIILLMGMVRTPEQGDYWSRDSRHGNAWIQSIMGEKQWKEIHRFLNFDVWKLQSDLNVRFRSAWRPYQWVAVDEGMIPFKGNFGGRQHVPSKPHSTGIKYFGLADSKGYLWSFWVYRGKAFHQSQFEQGNKQFNSAQPSAIITDFMSLLLDTFKAAYIVLCDSFFGSLHLAIQLLKLNAYFILATKGNRPSLLWTGFLHKGLKKGQTVTLLPPSDGPSFFGMSFWDRKKINFFANCSMPNVVSSVSRPQLIHDYNQHMNSVDRADQQHTLYLFSHRRRKYTRAIFYSLIKLAIHNAIILWEAQSGEQISQKDFLNLLTDDLAQEQKKYYYDSRKKK